MSKALDFIREHTVNKALADATSLNDFPLSRLVHILPDFFPEQFDSIIDDVSRTLGGAAYRGTIYVEVGTGGDRVRNDDTHIGEPFPPYRVNIEARGDRWVRATRARKMASTTHAIIARFPDNSW